MSETQTEFKLPTAGAEHDLLKPFKGEFKANVKMWMGPGEPMITSGKIKNSFHLNGLYLNQDYVGDPNDGPFPNFAGKGYWGYNQTQERYEGFWIDTASTIMQTETGQVDASGKVWTMHSEMPCPSTGEMMKKRSVITLIDNDHNKIEMFFTTSDGGEMKAMEIDYERV